MNGVTLGGFPVYDASEGSRESNWFEMSVGPRPGVGRFLMLRGDWDGLMTAVSGTSGVANLVMELTEEVNPDFNMTLPVFVVGAVPHSTEKDSTDVLPNANDVMEVVVHDLKYKLNLYSQLERAYNVQKNGFPYSGGPEFYTSTLNSGLTWTWSEVLTDVGVGVPAMVLPSWNPRNLVFDDVPLSEIAEVLAGALSAVIGWDWESSSYKLYDSGECDSYNDSLITAARSISIKVGTPLRNFQRLPDTFRVSFRKVPSGTDPYADRFHHEDVATGTGMAGQTKQTHYGFYLAQVDGGVVQNGAELGSVATYLKDSYLSEQGAVPEELIVPAIVPFKPDGCVRTVRWVSDARGARTYVRLNDDRPYSPATEVRTLGPRSVSYSDGIVNYSPTPHTLVQTGSVPEEPIRMVVLGTPTECDPAEEPFVTRWKFPFREVIPNCGSPCLDWVPKEGGLRSLNELLEEDPCRMAVNIWEEPESCDLENADCTSEAVPVDADLCPHQSFVPETAFAEGYLKRLPPPTVTDLEAVSFSRKLVVPLWRIPKATCVEIDPCDDYPYVNVVIAPNRYCVACPDPGVDPPPEI